MNKPAKKDTGTVLRRQVKPDETAEQHMAKLILDPQARHAFIGYILAGTLFKDQRPDSLSLVDELEARASNADAGGTAYASAVLVAQVHTLDALFTDLTHRAISTAGQFPDAHQRYLNMALKAQSKCRTTLEALAKLHQPREQVVRHIHVHEGGQAVVAEEFHHHAGGLSNAENADQPRAAIGAGGTGVGAALPRPDQIRQSLPSPAGPRKEPVPDARRRGRKRSAEGK